MTGIAGGVVGLGDTHGAIGDGALGVPVMTTSGVRVGVTVVTVVVVVIVPGLAGVPVGVVLAILIIPPSSFSETECYCERAAAGDHMPF